MTRWLLQIQGSRPKSPHFDVAKAQSHDLDSAKHMFSLGIFNWELVTRTGDNENSILGDNGDGSGGQNGFSCYLILRSPIVCSLEFVCDAASAF